MSDQSTTTSEDTSGKTRTKVLFGILGLALAALAYDYRVARVGVDSAYDQIQQRNVEVNAENTTMFTNLDVRELLDKEPSETFNDVNGDMVEVFSWRSGLPFRTHNLFAVYKSSAGKKMFYRHAKYTYEESKAVSNVSVPTGVQASEDELQAYQRQLGAPGGGGGGGDAFDPEAIFAERDVDGDGFWKEGEISGRIQEDLEFIDTDEDEAVSKDEWMARFQAREAAGGGRRGGRPDGQPGQRSRPELESDEAVAADKTELEATETAEPEKPEAEPEASKNNE
jgi:hypothetical protein